MTNNTQQPASFVDRVMMRADEIGTTCCGLFHEDTVRQAITEALRESGPSTEYRYSPKGSNSTGWVPCSAEAKVDVLRFITNGETYELREIFTAPPPVPEVLACPSCGDAGVSEFVSECADKTCGLEYSYKALRSICSKCSEIYVTTNQSRKNIKVILRAQNTTLSTEVLALQEQLAQAQAALANSGNRHEYTAPPGMVFIPEASFEELKTYRLAASKGEQNG